MKLRTFSGILLIFIFSLVMYNMNLVAKDSGPDEEAMFGSDKPETTKATEIIPENNKAEKNDSTETVENPLQVGGTFYYRFIASPQVDKDTKDTPISMPLQIDGFFDGRPNDRIRVFIDARLLYDATRDKYSQTTRGTSLGNSQSSSTASVSANAGSIPNNPQIVLDQAWLKFDILQAVFFTMGNQHVKWGTSRFWNPTDFVNTQKRDPLLQHDLRLGIPMLRMDIPLQKIQSNFTTMAFLDQPRPASTLGQMGGAARFETVIGETEIGVDFVYREHDKHSDNYIYGTDFSAPLGPFDIYGEAAWLTWLQTTHYKTLTSEKPPAFADLKKYVAEDEFKTPVLQASSGINFTFAWMDNRQATIGVEYFYNQAGYSDSLIYPFLIINNLYQPFYLGKHYAAIYLNAEGPDSGKHTNYSFSVISNLSDSSLIGRIDFTWRFLTYMTFEVFAAGHFGKSGTEFNFAVDTPVVFYQGKIIPAMNIPATMLDAGLALRTRF